MLCNSGNEDIIEGDAFECSVYATNCITLCVGIAFREVTFHKMSKATKQKWSCFKCKLDSNTASQYQDNIIQTKNLVASTPSKYTTNFKDLAESVDFMSNKFDNFGEQIKNVLASLNKNERRKSVEKAEYMFER